MPDGSDPESGQDERSGHRCQLNAWQGGRAASARHGLGVRGTSRRARTGDDVEWVAANVATGEGLDRVVAGVDAVVHLASATQRGANSDDVGVAGTRRLVAAGRQAGVRHLVYISIVGTDRVQLGYYRRKLAAGTTRRPGIGSRHGAAAGGCCRSR